MAAARLSSLQNLQGLKMRSNRPKARVIVAMDHDQRSADPYARDLGRAGGLGGGAGICGLSALAEAERIDDD